MPINQPTDQPRSDDMWLRRAAEAYSGSQSYFDANIRTQIENDLRQFQGKHPAGSKYHSDAYKARSKLFRPKTRANIRKAEATAAAAFFSTANVVDVGAYDDSQPANKATAAMVQALLQHRLTKTIPWFVTLLGAYQEAMTLGVVASYQYWEYDQVRGIDRPCVELIPIENIRFDPAANWVDPVNTSPYLIHLLPMYVKDVMGRMKRADPKTGAPLWAPLTAGQIATAQRPYDPIRSVREGNRADRMNQPTSLTDYSIVWVHRNIVEIDGQDSVYYTLGTQYRLTDPVPLKQAYFHGKRPYVLGWAVIEAHKTYPNSVPALTRDVQAEINQIANTRIDNINFVLNKRYFVQRNRQVDLRSLTRNAPGSATLMTDVEKDVKVVETSDVTGSSFQEHDRLNLDFDDLAGGFSANSVQSNRKLNETVGGMDLVSESGNSVDQYQLRTFVETWAEPVLRQLALLEQYYETDETIFALAAADAQVADRFGIDEITDEMLLQELVVNVNAGLGSTNPKTVVANFTQAMKAAMEIMGPQLSQRINPEEVINELFGKLGYKNGERFFNYSNTDPQVAQLVDQVQSLQQQLAMKQPAELTAAQVKKLNAEAVAVGVQGAYEAMQAGQVIAAVPEVAPIADAVMQASGYQVPNPPGVDPNFPQPAAAVATPQVVPNSTHPNMPAPPASAAAGASRGIETQRADGVPGYFEGGVINEGLRSKPFDGDSPVHDGLAASGSGALALGHLNVNPSFQLGHLNVNPTLDLSPSQPLQQHPGGPVGSTFAGNLGSFQPAPALPTLTGGSAGNFQVGSTRQGPAGHLIQGMAGRDKIPAITQNGAPLKVTDGEFILPQDVTATVGPDNLHQMIQDVRHADDNDE